MPPSYQNLEFQPDVKSSDIYVGAVIRQSRVSANLTRSQLSEMVALCPNQIRNYEIGKSSIRLNVLTRFDRFLNLQKNNWMKHYCIFCNKSNNFSITKISSACHHYVYIDDCDRHFGHNLRLARRRLGVRPCLVADELQVSHQQLNKYENGFNSIALDKYFFLCTLLNVDPIHLYRTYTLNAF